MSRKDIEELIKQLQETGKASFDAVTLERPVFNVVVDNLGRLEQALDNRPSLIKKLNEKITKLEGELEILRNQTRVNELEKKVQRLEGELQRSYATKNFTLKNGLLEIEKAYRDFIYGSPAVQSLWDEITLLLAEDKEFLPQHILARRNQYTGRLTSDIPTTNGGTDTERQSAAGDSLEGHEPVATEASEGQESTSYVQQQVDKFKDYTFTPGPTDPHDPQHTANLAQTSSYHPLYLLGGTPIQSMGGTAPPDARALDVVDDRPVGLDDQLAQLREQYKASETHCGGVVPPGFLAPHWGPMVPEPSPLRPVSLFSAGGEGDRPPDASYVDACRDELTSSLDQLRNLFAQYDWAPTPLPGATVGAGAAATAAAAVSGSRAPSPGRGMPDASAFTSMADSLEVSVEKLRQFFGQMQWAPVAGAGAANTGIAQDTAAAAPDARYFDSQAEVILASVQHLRSQFQEAAAAAAAAAAAEAAAAAAGGPEGWSGPEGAHPAAASSGTGGPPAASIPDARYFESQADAIAASVHELLRLYERSSGGALAAAGSAGLSQGPWPSGAATAAAATAGPGGPRTPGGIVRDDARAGDVISNSLDASVQPLVDLFSSFMSYLDSTRGSAGASGPWPMAPYNARAAGAAAAHSAAEGEAAQLEGDAAAAAEQLSQKDLIRLFGQYARAWPVAAAAAASLQRSGLGAAGGGGGGAPRMSTPNGGISRPGSQVELVYSSAGAAAAGTPASATFAAAPGSFTSPMPAAVKFRISVNTTGAADGAAVSARLSADPSLPAGVHSCAAGAADGAAPTYTAASTIADGSASAFETAASTAAAAVAPADSAAAESSSRAAPSSSAGVSPLDVLLTSLESRHGRGLATSPEAVAVWRDLLMLLGVDPTSRPLPGQPGLGPKLPPCPSQSAKALTQGHPAAASSGNAGAVAEGGLTAAAAAAGGAFAGGGVSSGGTAVGAERAVARATPSGAPGGSDASAAASEQQQHPADDDTAGRQRWAGGADEGVDCVMSRAGTGSEAAPSDSAPPRGAEAARAGAGAAPAGERDGVSAEEGPSAVVAATGVDVAGADTAHADVSAGEAPLPGVQGEGEAAVVGPAESAVAAHDSAVGAEAGGAAPRKDADAPALPSPRDASAAVADEGEQAAVEGASVRGAGDGAEAVGTSLAPADVAATDGTAAVDEEESLAAAVGPVADGPGLVAGGVRFHITLSEITAAEELAATPQPAALAGWSQSPSSSSLHQQQSQQPEQLIQFRAQVGGGGGVEPEAAAAAEAELAQLRLARHSLNEQLAATQDLVLHLNKQLKSALESREDMAARSERLSADLAAAQADADEARHESDVFMRDLVETKVKLAEVQGEYMQVYQALKKALGNEKDMMAKIDELERILAVVGPGDVAVDDEYGSTVGQVSATVTPREDALASAPAVGTPAAPASTPSTAAHGGAKPAYGMGLGLGMGLGWGYGGGAAGVGSASKVMERSRSDRGAEEAKGQGSGKGSRSGSYGGRSGSSGSGGGSGGSGGGGGEVVGR